MDTAYDSVICSCDLTAYIGLKFSLTFCPENLALPSSELSYYLTHNGTKPTLKRGTVYCVYLQHAPVQSMIMVLQYDGTSPDGNSFYFDFNMN